MVFKFSHFHWLLFSSTLSAMPLLPLSSVCTFDPAFGGKIHLDCDTKEKSVVKFQTELHDIKATVKCRGGGAAVACLGRGPLDTVTFIVLSDDRKSNGEPLCATSFSIKVDAEDYKTTCKGKDFKIEQRLRIKYSALGAPAIAPMTIPSVPPTSSPTTAPSAHPSPVPSTSTPTNRSPRPSAEPSVPPMSISTTAPSASPSSVPSATPTGKPTTAPTTSPSSVPSATPTGKPTAAPTTSPSSIPSATPTRSPTSASTSSADSSDGVWIETDENAPIDKRHEACFIMVGSKAYLTGGRRSYDLDVYDPVSRSWVKGQDSPKELHHMQCVTAQGKIWIVAAWTGAFPAEDNTEVSYVYDPATDKWSTRTAMPESRRRGGAAVVVSPDETKIYVSHGNDGGHEKDDFATSLGWLDVYDIATDTWTALSDSAPNPRAYGTTCDGKLVIAGGEGSGQAWDNVDIFDGKSWVTWDSLNVARHGTSLAVNCACNQIYIASGAAALGGRAETTSVETLFFGGEDVPCSL